MSKFNRFCFIALSVICAAGYAHAAPLAHDKAAAAADKNTPPKADSFRGDDVPVAPATPVAPTPKDGGVILKDAPPPQTVEAAVESPCELRNGAYAEGTLLFGAAGMGDKTTLASGAKVAGRHDRKVGGLDLFGKLSAHRCATRSSAFVQDYGLAGRFQVLGRFDKIEQTRSDSPGYTQLGVAVGPYFAFNVKDTLGTFHVLGGADMTTTNGITGGVVDQNLHLYSLRTTDDPNADKGDYDIGQLSGRLEFDQSLRARMGQQHFTDMILGTKLLWYPIPSKLLDIGAGPSYGYHYSKQYALASLASGAPADYKPVKGSVFGGALDIRVLNTFKGARAGIKVDYGYGSIWKHNLTVGIYFGN